MLRPTLPSPTWMFMDSMGKQIYQCAQYKQKICLQNMTAETLKPFLRIILTKTFPFMYQLLM